MLILKELNEYILSEASKSDGVLAIWETGMNFKNEYTDKEHWRFRKLLEVNPDVVGLDYNKSNVEDAQKEGYNFVYGDIEEEESLLKIGKKFDLILLIDVIEHINNVWGALRNLAGIMNTGSKLLITTPNPFYYQNFLKIFMKKDIWILEDHTNYIVAENFKQLVERQWFYTIASIDYINFIPTTQELGFFKRSLLKFIKKYNPLFMSNIVVELVKK